MASDDPRVEAAVRALTKEKGPIPGEVGLCEAALARDGSHSAAALHRETAGCIRWRPYYAWVSRGSRSLVDVVTEILEEHVRCIHDPVEAGDSIDRSTLARLIVQALLGSAGDSDDVGRLIEASSIGHAAREMEADPDRHLARLDHELRPHHVREAALVDEIRVLRDDLRRCQGLVEADSACEHKAQTAVSTSIERFPWIG